MFLDINDDWIDGLLSRVFLWILTPYLHVYGVRVFFCMAVLMWLRKGVVVTC